MKSIIIYFALGTALILASCTAKKNTQETAQSQETNKPSSEISITDEQFKQGKMKLTKPQKRLLHKGFELQAEIKLLPQALAMVSPLIDGQVYGLNLQEGSFVTQGQTLFYVKDNAIIQLHQDYLESMAQLAFAETDFSRKTELKEKNGVSASEWEKAQAEVKSMRAITRSLARQLEIIGISASKIQETEVIQSAIAIQAPIAGTISHVSINNGDFLTKGQSAIEIVNKRKVYAEAKVFETTLNQVRKGQALQLSLPNHVTLESQIKAINAKVASAEKYALLISEPLNLSPEQEVFANQYCSMQVVTNADSLLSLPLSCIQKEGQSFYVLVQQADAPYTFVKTAIEPIFMNDSFAALPSDIAFANQAVLEEGAYDLLANE